ncbi:MAG: hypothetical protein JRE23_12215 [Deltaproteobacteria bacterium]|nr:hypothetical protein [Deltaproteobacteria bacterium]
MHSLPTIVVMNMTDEQREEYNRQESARIARREERERVDQIYHANCMRFWGSMIVILAIATIAFFVV